MQEKSKAAWKETIKFIVYEHYMLASDIMNIPIMPGAHKGYTTPHRCATVNDSKRNQPSDRD